MAHNFESIPSIALEIVTGGANDGTDGSETARDQFTTGGSIVGGKQDRFTTGGTIGGDGPFTTGGSF